MSRGPAPVSPCPPPAHVAPSADVRSESVLRAYVCASRQSACTEACAAAARWSAPSSPCASSTAGASVTPCPDTARRGGGRRACLTRVRRARTARSHGTLARHARTARSHGTLARHARTARSHGTRIRRSAWTNTATERALWPPLCTSFAARLARPTSRSRTRPSSLRTRAGHRRCAWAHGPRTPCCSVG